MACAHLLNFISWFAKTKTWTWHHTLQRCFWQERVCGPAQLSCKGSLLQKLIFVPLKYVCTKLQLNEKLDIDGGLGGSEVVIIIHHCNLLTWSWSHYDDDEGIMMTIWWWWHYDDDGIMMMTRRWWHDYDGMMMMTARLWWHDDKMMTTWWRYNYDDKVCRSNHSSQPNAEFCWRYVR